MPTPRWNWPTLEEDMTGIPLEDLSRWGLTEKTFDPATGAVSGEVAKPMPGPLDWFRCACGRRVRRYEMRRNAGTGFVRYPFAAACRGCFALLDQQGDISFAEIVEALGAPTEVVAKVREREMQRQGQRRTDRRTRLRRTFRR